VSDEMKRDRVPQALLEQLAVGELSDARVAALREEFGEASLTAQRAQLDASTSELRSRLPDADVFARRVSARRAQPTGPRVAPWAWAAPALAAAVLLGVWNQRAPDDHSPAGGMATGVSEERIKGLKPRLHVYRKRGSEVERLEPGASARPGDVVQLGYVAAGLSYGVIVSVDGRGVVTLHLPATGTEAAVLESDGVDLLPDAYELDDAPDYERFFLVASATRFDAGRVLAAALALGRDGGAARTRPLDLEEPLYQAAFLVSKEAR